MRLTPNVAMYDPFEKGNEGAAEEIRHCAFPGARVTCTSDIAEALDGADVIMMLRVQKERMQGAYFPSVREYFRLYALTRSRVERARKDVIILHPGPMNRGLEIESAVADGPYSLILDQVTNGVAIRMAVLYLLTGAGAEAS